MSITHATAKGSRPYQEDRSFTFETPEYLAFGVFDGHGGSQCAELCADDLPRVLTYWLNSEDDISLVLKETFAAINSPTKHMHDGCAASVVVIDHERKQVTVAVLGDSPVLVHRGDKVWTAPEHNVRSNQAEADAAIARGGYVSQGYLFGSGSNGLQMSRAFGDASLSSVLNREPEIFTLHLDRGSWVLVATDGAFDPAHHSDTGSKAVLELVKAGKDAQAIVDRALAARTGDNVTAILWRP